MSNLVMGLGMIIFLVITFICCGFCSKLFGWCGKCGKIVIMKYHSSIPEGGIYEEWSCPHCREAIYTDWGY